MESKEGCAHIAANTIGVRVYVTDHGKDGETVEVWLTDGEKNKANCRLVGRFTKADLIKKEA